MAITVVARNDFEPAPRVEITFDWPGSAERVEVWRYADGEATLVSGGRLDAVAPSAFLVDYFAPLDTAVTYEATGWRASRNTPIHMGTTGVSTDVVLSSVLPDDRLAIIQDPYAPSRAVPVLLEAAAVSSLTYSRDVSLVQPIAGSRIGIGSPAGLAEAVPLSIYTTTEQGLAAVEQLLRDTYPLVLRTVPPIELPRVAYASIASYRRVPVDREWIGWNLWDIEVTLVRAPSASVVLPVHTYQEVLDIYPTYGDLAASKAAYLDLLRDPRLGA